MAFYNQSRSSSLAFLIAGAVWFAVGTLYGLFSAIDLVAPEFFANIPFLVFGRVRPVHTNTVIFGFAANMLIGAGLYYMPALLKTRLWSEKLGWISFVLYNLTVLSGPWTFAWAQTQGREYAEYVWLADLSLVTSYLVMILNLVMTILTRREKTLYVGVWYFTATFLWSAPMYCIGNVIWSTKGALPGLIDSLFQWYYGHNLVGLLLTPLSVGAAFFVIPRITRTPLFSHALSLIGFWTLVLLYSHIGGHHLLQAPIPNWLKAVSVVDSVGMVIPVFTVLANQWMTARGHGGQLLKDPAGRFIIISTVWYLLVCVQGPFQSLPAIQRVTHFNNWTIGHSHIAVLGFSGFAALGAMYYVLPYVCGRKLYSQRLVNLQFGLVLFGLMGFFFVLTIAGLIQGESWNNGETVYRVLPEIVPYMIIRAASGILIITGAFVGLYNVLMTVFRGERFYAPSLAQEGMYA